MYVCIYTININTYIYINVLCLCFIEVRAFLICLLKDCCDPPSPFLSQCLEVNHWNPDVQNTLAEFVQLDGKLISEMLAVL